MTVSEGSRSADIDLTAATQQFNGIYVQYADRLYRFVWKRLDLHQRELAEDLTSETFMELWRRYMLTGRGHEVTKPYGLLCTMARSRITYHWNLKKNGERAIDFSDPVNTPIVATGHSYAIGTPGLARLSDELDAAMERMTEASKQWRVLHKESHRHRKALSGKYVRDVAGMAKERRQHALNLAEERQAKALEAFRASCLRVGALRAELEEAGGPNWKSAAGMPSSAARSNTREGSVTADLSVTHCSNGHLLSLDNTYFPDNGTRRCWTCIDDRTESKRKARVGAGAE